MCVNKMIIPLFRNILITIRHSKLQWWIFQDKYSQLHLGSFLCLLSYCVSVLLQDKIFYSCTWAPSCATWPGSSCGTWTITLAPPCSTSGLPYQPSWDLSSRFFCSIFQTFFILTHSQVFFLLQKSLPIFSNKIKNDMPTGATFENKSPLMDEQILFSLHFRTDNGDQFHPVLSTCNVSFPSIHL